jgi:hypothetical protein
MTTTNTERKLKTALDESRLLILGAQVLFGFQFQATFQDLFGGIPDVSRWIHGAGLMFLLVSICFLIAPSLHHQILFQGESREGAIGTETWFAGASLLPFTLGLGAAAFVVFERLFGRTVGSLISISFMPTGLTLPYGVGFEARLMLSGGQALLGFQLVATLTKSFHELPNTYQYIHATGLCAVALAVTLLMTPAAVHRIAFDGEDDAGFFRIGSLLVITASCPLAFGIAADVAVVFYKISRSNIVAGSSGVAALCMLLVAWLAYPYWRSAVPTSASKQASHG